MILALSLSLGRILLDDESSVEVREEDTKIQCRTETQNTENAAHRSPKRILWTSNLSPHAMRQTSTKTAVCLVDDLWPEIERKEEKVEVACRNQICVFFVISSNRFEHRRSRPILSLSKQENSLITNLVR